MDAVVSAPPVTEKAPDVGCHRPEGENPNPFERNQILSHPTPDHWATATNVSSDAPPFITHSRDFKSGLFDLVIAHTHCELDLGTDVIVKWDEPGDIDGVTHVEEFSISVSRITALSAALSEAASIVKGIPDPTLSPINRAIQELTKTIEELDRQGLHDLALTVAASLFRLRTRNLTDGSAQRTSEDSYA